MLLLSHRYPKFFKIFWKLTELLTCSYGENIFKKKKYIFLSNLKLPQPKMKKLSSVLITQKDSLIKVVVGVVVLVVQKY